MFYQILSTIALIDQPHNVLSFRRISLKAEVGVVGRDKVNPVWRELQPVYVLLST